MAARREAAVRVRSIERPAGYALRPARELEAELRARVRGEVRFDAGSRALYATDSSNYRQTPVGVVLPRDAEDVELTMAACRERGVPVLPRGGGTSLAGQCCNAAVVLDFSKYMNRILDLDPERKLARVQPGVVLDTLRNAAERYHLTFAPDPATHNRCTLGGMLGNNSCGVHSIMSGKTDDNVEEMEVLTYDGERLRVGRTSQPDLERIVQSSGRQAEIYTRLKALVDQYEPLIRQRYPRIPRRVSGYNLPQLLPENGMNVARALVGSEGTCVTILDAWLNLVESPPGRALLVLGFRDIYAGCDRVPDILGWGPIGLEGFDRIMIDGMRAKNLLPGDVALLPPGDGWLLVEFGGRDEAEAGARAQALMDALKKQGHAPDMRLFTDRHQAERIWHVRESALGATAIIPGQGEYWPGWEDSAAPPERMGSYLRDLRKLMDQFHYAGSFYGHFGQGCLHTRINFDLTTESGIRQFREFMGQAADLCIAYGGSLSGEHGDGQARGELLGRMFGDELVGAMREFKSIWDGAGKMNPGKVVEPFRLDENLRLGARYDPWEPDTFFGFPQDGGSLAHAALRCVGVGKCRRDDGGTMCPSYRATREEMHSTRGRARLLFEMLQGQVIGDQGWRDPSVREALDLCLACKGCKGECPVNVDMATYKAEFLAHYYQGRLRPRQAYAFGLIHWWVRIAALAPGLLNLGANLPMIGQLGKALVGMASQRRVPGLAAQTFRAWFRARPPRQDGAPVLLWVDTFNNHFTPEVARAAAHVLESAGRRVMLPPDGLCCGRPLYDYGFLDQARELLEQAQAGLRPHIEAGTPIVGLEPSCVAVFRDELTNLFPRDELAGRLSRSVLTLGEFLAQVEGYQPPRLDRRAILHGHCHQKALMGTGSEEQVLRQMGLDVQALDSGCCGMAGSFGFESGEHYQVSMSVGEQVLLPAVRQAHGETLIVADGFSCREQIAQTTPRRALHLAQVIEMGLREGPGGPRRDAYPEAGYAPGERADGRAAVALGVGLAAAVAAGWLLAKKRRR